METVNDTESPNPLDLLSVYSVPSFQATDIAENYVSGLGTLSSLNCDEASRNQREGKDSSNIMEKELIELCLRAIKREAD